MARLSEFRTMYKGLFTALLIVGAALIVIAFQAADSIHSEASSAIAGLPPKQSLRYFILGSIALLLGTCGLALLIQNRR